MIQLLPLEPRWLERLQSDPRCIAEVCSNAEGVLALVMEIADQTRQMQAQLAIRTPWLGHFAVETVERRIVGACGFKGNPTPAGDVEIAYFTFPGFEGHGHATAMAAALIKIAFQSSSVQRVVAHTLAELNASTRVLQKVGMSRVGEVIDPEDGRVWRWELTRPTFES
jgi:ribosomal-protein-alanine N-acetyltransferase